MSGFTFGAPASTGGFSFGTTAPTTTTTAPASTGFGFSFGTATPAAATAAPAAPAVQPQQPLPTGAYLPHGGYVRDVQDPVIKKINEISDAVNPSSPNCLFQYVLYNLLPANSPFKERLTRPPHANEEVWKRGVAENPDPERYAPCLVVGWADLLIRLQEQQKALSTHIATMEHLSTDVTNNLLSVQHCLQQDLQKAKEKQLILNNRILNIISRINLLVFADMPLTDAEVDYRQRLEQLALRLSTPGEYLEKIANLNELVSIQTSIAQNNRKKKSLQQSSGDSIDNTDSDNGRANTKDKKRKDNGGNESGDDGSDDDTFNTNNNNPTNANNTRNNANTNYNDYGIQLSNHGAVYYSEYGTIPSLSSATDQKGNTTASISTLLNVVNDQSRMVKELVDEVSLCITDVQVCQDALTQEY